MGGRGVKRSLPAWCFSKDALQLRRQRENARSAHVLHTSPAVRNAVGVLIRDGRDYLAAGLWP